MALYQQVMPGANPAERYIAIVTDAQYRNRTVVAANRLMDRAGAPVFMYSFAWNSPRGGGKLGAPHAVEVPFVFDAVDLTGVGAADRKLSGIMADVWSAFARTGVPQTDAIPHWFPHQRGTRAMMIFEDQVRITHDQHYSRRRLWSQISTSGE